MKTTKNCQPPPPTAYPADTTTTPSPNQQCRCLEPPQPSPNHHCQHPQTPHNHLASTGQPHRRWELVGDRPPWPATTQQKPPPPQRRHRATIVQINTHTKSSPKPTKSSTNQRKGRAYLGTPSSYLAPKRSDLAGNRPDLTSLVVDPSDLLCPRDRCPRPPPPRRRPRGSAVGPWSASPPLAGGR
ncbi:hypothetical protein Dimus_039047 [Dionaea muscipula]